MLCTLLRAEQLSTEMAAIWPPFQTVDKVKSTVNFFAGEEKSKWKREESVEIE